MNSKGTLQAAYSRAESERTTAIGAARVASALSDPTILPTEGRAKHSEYERNYQSLGGRGLSMIEGSILTNMHPPGIPWVAYQPSAQVAYGVPDEREFPDAAVAYETNLRHFERRLQLRSMLVQAILESAGTSTSTQPSGFRMAQRQAISSMLVTGETLQRMRDDFTLVNYRRDQYVSRRDDAGAVMWHIIRESVDAEYALTPKQREQAKIKDDDAGNGRHFMFTRTKWQPESKVWTVEQEVNGEIINEFDEKVSSFVCPYYKLSPGDDYAHGYFELVVLGDLALYEELRERIAMAAEAASRVHPILDPTSKLRLDDFNKPNGTPLVDWVEGGQAKKIAFLRLDKTPDLQFAVTVMNGIEATLGAAMLLNQQVIRDSERTTATEVERVIQQNEGLFGGLAGPYIERHAGALARIANAKIEEQKLAPPIERDAFDVVVLTGIEALARVRKARTLLQAAEVARSLGPAAAASINERVLMEVFFRYSGVYEPGLVKSEQQVQQELESAMRRQLQMEAGSQAITSAGAIAEGQAARSQS